MTRSKRRFGHIAPNGRRARVAVHGPNPTRSFARIAAGICPAPALSAVDRSGSLARAFARPAATDSPRKRPLNKKPRMRPHPGLSRAATQLFLAVVSALALVDRCFFDLELAVFVLALAVEDDFAAWDFADFADFFVVVSCFACACC